MIVSFPEPGETKGTPMGNLEIEDYSVKRWPSGKIYVRYLYKDLLDRLAEDMKANINDSYDNFVVIDGPVGSGKSNLAYALCIRYDQGFDFRQYVYDANGFKSKLNDDISKKTFWIDEGSAVANNRDWNTEGNKHMVLFLETMRSKTATYITCIPNKERLDIAIRDDRVQYWIHCIPMSFERSGFRKRGYFELRKRTPEGKMVMVGYGTYPPMPPEVKAEYEEIKAKSQEAILKKIVGEDKEKTGSAYKKKYEAKCREINSAILALHDSKSLDDEGIMQLFGIENRNTYYRRLQKARSEQYETD